MSPSALIPFCEFGGNMSIVGVKIDQFDVPVCNSFQARVLNDQLCYEVDPNRFKESFGNMKKEFRFFIDVNTDRQTESKDEEFTIHLNTLG